jgi:hypothetical protein
LSLQDILEEIANFLKNRIRKYDIVVSRERSGFRIFQMVEEKYLKSGINHVPSESVPTLDLKEKNVLVFDDTTTTGLDLTYMKIAISKLGAKVDTMAYVVLDTCPEENRPDLYVEIVNFNGYQMITHNLSEDLKDQDTLLDTDHIQVKGNISPISTTYLQIYDTLVPLGDPYEGESLPNGRQFGLREPNFYQLQSANIPYGTNQISTWKVRIRCNNDGSVRIIPLTFPVLDFNRLSCNGMLELPFCRKYGTLFEGSNDIKKLLCCFCIIYNSSDNLLTNFFKAWKKTLESQGIQFNLEKVVYEDAKYIFNDSSLEQNLYWKIKQVLIEKAGE